MMVNVRISKAVLHVCVMLAVLSLRKTLAQVPTVSPTTSKSPTQPPSLQPSVSPTQSPAPSVSPFPTTSPSWTPSVPPTLSPAPTLHPSPVPTSSPQPTASWAPTSTHSPTKLPSLRPTKMPSFAPSRTERPTAAVNHNTSYRAILVFCIIFVALTLIAVHFLWFCWWVKEDKNMVYVDLQKKEDEKVVEIEKNSEIDSHQPLELDELEEPAFEHQPIPSQKITTRR